MSEGNNEFRKHPSDFDAMVKFHEKWILALAIKKTSDLDGAETIRVNVFIKAYQHWDRFYSKGHIASERRWLLQRFNWAVADWGRSNKRAKARPVINIDSDVDGQDDPWLKDSYAHQKWAEAYLSRTLELFRILLEKDPEAYGLTGEEMRWYDEYYCLNTDYQEIAKKYTVAELTVRQGIRRVEAVMRELYCSEEDGGKMAPSLDSRFDAVLENMKDHPPRRTNLPTSGFFTVRAIHVFAVYYSSGTDKMTIGDANRLVTAKLGRGPNLDGAQLQHLRACFCIRFEESAENRECVDALEFSFAKSGPNIEMLSKREKLLLAGRGYDMPAQTFPADFDYLPRWNR